MPGEVTFAVTFAAEVVNVTPMRLLDQVTCAETFWLAPLMMPVAVNCAVARSALPVPLGINMTVALGGSTASDSRPLIGGGPPRPPMPPEPVEPVGLSLVPAHPKASVPIKTDNTDNLDNVDRMEC